MKRELRCVNKDCESMAFSVHIIVGPSGEIAERIGYIDGQHFECCECHDIAKWIEINNE